MKSRKEEKPNQKDTPKRRRDNAVHELIIVKSLSSNLGTSKQAKPEKTQTPLTSFPQRDFQTHGHKADISASISTCVHVCVRACASSHCPMTSSVSVFLGQFAQMLLLRGRQVQQDASLNYIDVMVSCCWHCNVGQVAMAVV